ncbi:unnamed protein product [Cyprideis torosa]|uniref:Uncharacterized protein n=1 Tax=Cyprideis torosa TaxID=163714 RepID=A0A7R8WHC3_9CRUS|nr:unnamed protein product [Cyprideis torosa]CAG0892772.1 unnamed protein product [Cyprideis torosa]
MEKVHKLVDGLRSSSSHGSDLASLKLDDIPSKEKMQRVNQMVSQLLNQTQTNRRSGEFATSLQGLVSSLLSLCDDPDADIRMGVDEQINLLIHDLREVCLPRFLSEFMREVKSPQGKGRLKVALTKLGTLAEFIPYSKRHLYASNLVQGLQGMFSGAEGDEGAWEAVAGALPALWGILGRFAAEADVKGLLAQLEEPLTSGSAPIRRSVALILAELVCSKGPSLLPPFLHGAATPSTPEGVQGVLLAWKALIAQPKWTAFCHSKFPFAKLQEHVISNQYVIQGVALELVLAVMSRLPSCDEQLQQVEGGSEFASSICSTVLSSYLMEDSAEDLPRLLPDSASRVASKSTATQILIQSPKAVMTNIPKRRSDALWELLSRHPDPQLRGLAALGAAGFWSSTTEDIRRRNDLLSKLMEDSSPMVHKQCLLAMSSFLPEAFVADPFSRSDGLLLSTRTAHAALFIRALRLFRYSPYWLVRVELISLCGNLHPHFIAASDGG